MKRRRTGKSLVYAGLLVVMVLFAFWPVARQGVINFDDDSYITNNPYVQGGLSSGNVAWAFTTFHMSNWHPVTWLSHMADVELFGDRLGAHHVVSLLFHLANALLLFLVLRASTGSSLGSFLAAAIFAAHPLRVESVAWLAERKDLLSGLFFLLALAAYVRWVRRGGAGWYAAVVLCFAVGLMAKPMIVTFPFVLLLFDFWPLRRLDGDSGSFSLLLTGRRCAEKAPLFILSAASSTVTYIAQHQSGVVQPLQALPPINRIWTVFSGYLTYVGKMLWPAHLAVYYPYETTTPSPWVVGTAIAAVAALSAAALALARRRPFLTVGWFWYLGTLVPVIGLVQVGHQSVADRYTYLPSIGFFLALIWLAGSIVPAGGPLRQAGKILAGTLLLALVIVTCRQVRYWRDGSTLFKRTIEVTDGNWVAWTGLAANQGRIGRSAEAVDSCREAVRLGESYPQTHLCLGSSLVVEKRYEEAIGPLQRAVSFDPPAGEAYRTLGEAFFELGRFPEAGEAFRNAISLGSDDGGTYYKLGLTYNSLGRHRQEIEAYREVLRTSPDHWEAHYNMGLALYALQRYPEAIESYRRALAISPDFAEAYNNLGAAYAKLGRLAEARSAFEQAVLLAPGDALARLNLGSLLIDLGNWEGAAAQYRHLLELDRDAARRLREMFPPDRAPAP